MTDKEKTTALIDSVGAEPEQSSSKIYKNSIPDNPSKYNDSLPDVIIQHGRFCCWRYEERNGKKTKVPYQPDTGMRAKSNDPSSFVSYGTAVQASGYDGIGIGIFEYSEIQYLL